MTKGKVAMALSGGVDSSTAALLLKEAAYDVIGVHMRLWDAPHSDYQANRAEDVCRILDITYHQIDLQKEFESYVVDYFCREYQQGRTPNPCVACNQYIKFGLLLDKAFSLGADYLATGHYARVEHASDGHRLLKAADVGKDQSYFLYTLTQGKLGHVLFPLGGHNKDEVKQMAKQAGLPTATRSSQDICFISQKNYGTFLSQRFPTQPGDVVDTQGRKLGQHQGIAFYTIGQRHGLGLSSTQVLSAGEPLYVIKIEPESNRIVLGHERELYSQKLTAQKLNWISGKASQEPITVTAKIRYKSKEAEAILFPLRHCKPERSEGEAISDVHFAQPQKAVTPGQAIVFYNMDEVLGGGIIYKTEK
ncbi:MAG: tRNA 2-thiouridine(34) synthase MnmA [Chloroflexota bacterium]